MISARSRLDRGVISARRTEQVQLHTILEARYNHDQLTAAIVADHLRPREPEPSAGAPPEIIALVRRCWSAEPAERPDAAAVCSELRPLADALAAAAPCAVAAGVAAREPEPRATAATVAPPASEHAPPPAQRVVPPAPSALPAASAQQEQACELAGLLGCADGAGLRVGADASAGKRGGDRMEDRHVMRCSGGACVAAVFDGHNGDGAAEFCSAELLPELLNALRPVAIADASSRARALDAALSRAFPRLNARFLAEFPRDDSGCTALAAICTPEVITVANAGDGQAWLWRGDEVRALSRTLHRHQSVGGPTFPIWQVVTFLIWQVVALNREHLASDDGERTRILAAGTQARAHGQSAPLPPPPPS